MCMVKKKKRNQYGIPRILSNSGWLLCYLVCYFVCLFVFGVHSLAADVSPMWWDWEEWESRGGKAWWIWCLLNKALTDSVRPRPPQDTTSMANPDWQRQDWEGKSETCSDRFLFPMSQLFPMNNTPTYPGD